MKNPVSLFAVGAVGIVLLVLSSQPVRAQGSWTTGTFSQNLTVGGTSSPGTLTVTGTGAVDFQVPAMMLGTWSGSGSGPGLTVSYSGTSLGTQVNFASSGTSTTWVWWQNSGSASPTTSM